MELEKVVHCLFNVWAHIVAQLSLLLRIICQHYYLVLATSICSTN